MLKLMIKFFLFFVAFFFKIAFTNAEIVKLISVTGNERIANNTIVIFSKINIGDDLAINDLNNVINNLYDTDFFKDVSAEILEEDFLKNRF